MEETSLDQLSLGESNADLKGGDANANIRVFHHNFNQVGTAEGR